MYPASRYTRLELPTDSNMLLLSTEHLPDIVGLKAAATLKVLFKRFCIEIFTSKINMIIGGG